jgi:Lrp/AsnC family transcriptional regulator, leucine-responsive regulatory protein
MDLSFDKLMDATSRKIVQLLVGNARLSFSELGRQVGLTQPAAAERVKRLEEAGVITGYYAAVDRAKLGQPILAFIRLTTPPEKYAGFYARVDTWTEVLECHHVSGLESFYMKVAVSSTAHLEELIGRIGAFGQTSTTVVLSTRKNREHGFTE